MERLKTAPVTILHDKTRPSHPDSDFIGESLGGGGRAGLYRGIGSDAAERVSLEREIERAPLGTIAGFSSDASQP